MKVKPALFALVLALAVVHTVAAQDNVTVSFLDGRTGIRLELDPATVPPISFVLHNANQIATYKFYEVETPDPDNMCTFPGCINELRNILDPMNLPKCADDACKRIELHFRSGQSLPPDKNFILVVQHFKDDGTAGKLAFTSETKAVIVDPFNADDKKRGFSVKANATINAPQLVTAQRVVYRLSKDSLNVVESQDNPQATLDSKLPHPNKNTLSFRFHERLIEGQQYDLVIPSGIKDDTGQDLVAKGTLKIPGNLAPSDDPKFSFTLSSVSAAKHKSIFDLTSNFATTLSSFRMFGRNWYPEPNVSVDVGLRSTTSNNSITIGFPFTTKVLVRTVQLRSGTKTNIPAYATWVQTPWYQRSHIKFYLGPKVELDRDFKRVNIVGNVRLDLDLYRWLGTIAYKRGLIAKEPGVTRGIRFGGIGKEKAASLEGISRGFKLVPYLSFDFGGHVNNETVTKDTSNVFVPRHPIFRSYVGANGTIEWRTGSLPTTLTLDESLVYMATRERIGFTTDDGAFLRQLRGWHPHFKTSLDFALDPAKHYSFDLTYENGRLAPNFEYLNKLTTGIKMTY
jgi:hypothetical protein